MQRIDRQAMPRASGSSRLAWLDCMRAILIIAMVVGHAGSPWTTYVYMVHMPGFLFISGFASYLSRSGATYHPLKYIKRRVGSILVPALLINIVFLVLYWIAEKCGVYAYLQASPWTSLTLRLAGLFSHLSTADLGGATWFLFVLFEVEVIFTLFHWIAMKARRTWIAYGLSLICVVAGYRLAARPVYARYDVDLALIAMLYYAIGYWTAEQDLLRRVDRRVMLPLCLTFTVFFGSFWFKGQLPMNWPTRQFADPFIQLLSCFSGLYLVYEAAQWLCRHGCARPFTAIGQRTYCILVLHFMAFKLVFLAYHLLGIGSIPLGYLQNLTPTYQLSANGGWLVITAVTLAICMGISYAADHCLPLNYLFNAKWQGMQRRRQK